MIKRSQILFQSIDGWTARRTGTIDPILLSLAHDTDWNFHYVRSWTVSVGGKNRLKGLEFVTALAVKNEKSKEKWKPIEYFNFN